MKNTVNFDLPSGIKVKDKIQQVEGVITTRCERINGCVQYYIQLPMRDGKQEGFWTDIENIEVLEKGKQKPEKIKFKFETGDRVRNRIHNIEGIITAKRVDLNKCLHYWYETENQDRDGKVLEYCGFEQELEYVDAGLNAPDEKPLDKARTGCSNNIPSGRF